jgi:hypothetical protein
MTVWRAVVSTLEWASLEGDGNTAECPTRMDHKYLMTGRQAGEAFIGLVE